MPQLNEFGQPVGDPLRGWAPPSPPGRAPLPGRTVVLEPLDEASHSSALFEAFTGAGDELWTYMSFGPFDGPEDLGRTIEWMSSQTDWLPYAIVVDGRPLGFASYLRIDPPQGLIEVGAIVLSPALMRTTAATEALYLMIRNTFELGYRRCEWKCDDLNHPSRRAGERLGFRYEGTFRKAMHYKGRNRDTAWFAIVDDDWPALDSAFQEWLQPSNFDASGRQRTRLGDLISASRA